jgi:hypothetical protein
MLPAPTLEHVADLDVRVAAAVEIGAVAAGTRRVIAITGGTVAGPRLSGRILPGGADFQLIRADGVAELHARYVIETDARELIYVENSGLRHGPPEAMARIKRGEPVDPALIYCRTTPRFETAAPALQWLVRDLFVASVARFPDRVAVSVYRVG